MAKKKKTATKSKAKSKIGIDPLAWIEDDEEPVVPVFKDAEFVDDSKTPLPHEGGAQNEAGEEAELKGHGLDVVADKESDKPIDAPQDHVAGLVDDAANDNEVDTDLVADHAPAALADATQTGNNAGLDVVERHVTQIQGVAVAEQEVAPERDAQQAEDLNKEVQSTLLASVTELVQEGKPEHDQGSGMTKNTGDLDKKGKDMVLESIQDISNVTELKQKLEGAADANELSIDARSVERVDTTTLQLLYAFSRELEGQGRSLRIQPSEAFKKSAELLGMSRLISL